MGAEEPCADKGLVTRLLCLVFELRQGSIIIPFYPLSSNKDFPQDVNGHFPQDVEPDEHEESDSRRSAQSQKVAHIAGSGPMRHNGQ
jgi:hypothetical protein